MKQKLLLGLLLAAMVSMPCTSRATTLLTENFDYAAGGLYGQGKTIDPTGLGWIKYGTNSEDPIQVVDRALTYTGYQNTAAGKAVELKGTNLGEDLQIAFATSEEAFVSGTIYAAMLVKVTNATNANTYFTGFTGKTSKGWVDGVNATEYGRAFVMAGSDDTKFKFGVSKNNAAPSETTEELNVGETYLMVIKYEFVDGATNDVVTLWVNPTTDATAEPAATISADVSQGDASTKNGLQGIELRQGTTASKAMAAMTIDAIRVATAWADLFETSGGDDPKPVATLSIEKTSATSEYHVQNEVFVDTFVVKGANLSDDAITTTCVHENITIIKGATLDKDKVMSETGDTVIIRNTAATSGENQITITVAQGDTKKEIKYAWTVTAPTPTYPTIASWKEALQTSTHEEGLMFTGTAIVTFSKAGIVYIEDETGAMRLDRNLYLGDVNIPLVMGDRVMDVIAVYDYGTYYATYFEIEGSGYTTIPTVVTLAELNANKANYLYRLLKIEGVTFESGEFASTQTDCAQGDETIKVNAAVLAGEAKPVKANITGIWNTSFGSYYLQLRTDKDIEKIAGPPTAIENTTTEDEMEIYTPSGIRVSALQPGMNIVRQGKTTYKVVR